MSDIDNWENEGGFITCETSSRLNDTVLKHIPVKPGSKEVCSACVMKQPPYKIRGLISEAEHCELQKKFDETQQALIIWQDAFVEQKAYRSNEVLALQEELNSLQRELNSVKENLIPLAIDIAASDNREMLYAFFLGTKEIDDLISKNKARDAKNFLLQFVIGKEKFDQLKEFSLQKRYGTILTAQNPKYSAANTKK